MISRSPSVVLRPVTGGRSSHSVSVSSSLSTGSLATDNLLKGTKPGDLPVQLPTEFKFVVNRKTASALGIEVPLDLLLAADEVME